MSSSHLTTLLVVVVAWTKAWAGLATSVFFICLTFFIPSLKSEVPYYHIRAEPGVEHHDRARFDPDAAAERKEEDDAQEAEKNISESEPDIRKRDSISSISSSESKFSSKSSTKSMTARVHRKLKKVGSKALSKSVRPKILSKMPSFDLSGFPLSRTSSIEPPSLAIQIPSDFPLTSTSIGSRSDTSESLTPTNTRTYTLISRSTTTPHCSLQDQVQLPFSPSGDPFSPTESSACFPLSKQQQKVPRRSASGMGFGSSNSNGGGINSWNVPKMKAPTMVRHRSWIKLSSSSSFATRY